MYSFSKLVRLDQVIRCIIARCFATMSIILLIFIAFRRQRIKFSTFHWYIVPTDLLKRPQRYVYLLSVLHQYNLDPHLVVRNIFQNHDGTSSILHHSPSSPYLFIPLRCHHLRLLIHLGDDLPSLPRALQLKSTRSTMD